MKKFIALFFVFFILAISGSLFAKERHGANLEIEKKGGQKVKGELIAVKQDSLLLKDSKSGADVSVDMGDIKVIAILKKSKFLEKAGLDILIGGGIGAFLTYAEDAEAPFTKILETLGMSAAGG